jgi:hypothetical protein
MLMRLTDYLEGIRMLADDASPFYHENLTPAITKSGSA